MAARRPQVFLGRTNEREVVDRLLVSVRAGRSAVLVIRGEAGIGKTMLLRYAARQASGFRVAQIAGVEAEMELPFAGAHQLCGPLSARLDALPPPQRDALRVALGLASGDVPDRFLVALAVLSLLSAVAEERPLLCLVEDAQWLDAASAQVIGFVGRRLLAESVGIVVAVREPAGSRDFTGLPELPLGGLDENDARALLTRAVQGRLDDRIRDRIVAETRGNPLALLELPRSMSAAELAGGFEIPLAAGLPGRIQDHYLSQVTTLPQAVRELILLAAADPVGDATLLWRAAQNLEITPGALTPARSAQLLEIGDRVRFRHPHVRSAAYRAASPGERQRVHAALAEVSDPVLDADRRAWHRALAATGPDEDIAAELEHLAGRAQTRGGLAATAAFLERAAAMTVDPVRRARRALAAAQAQHAAGAPEAALELLTRAQAGPLTPLQSAKGDVLRAEIAFTTNRGSDAPQLLLDGARRLESLDVALARETYLDALTAAQFAGGLAAGAVVRVAEAARAAAPSPSPRAPDLLLDSFTVLIMEGHGAAAPLLQQALNAFRDDDSGANGGFRWLWLAEEAAQELWDHDTWDEFAVRQLRMVRDAGALSVLPLALSAVISARIYAGDFTTAASLTDEVKIATEATGSQLAPYGALILAAWEGREADLTKLIEATLKDVVPRGEGIGVSCCQWVTALLYNGLGRYEQALAAAQQVVDPPRRLDWTRNVTLPELVEAAVRAGQPQHAHEALEELTDITRPSGADWGLGLEARCRALLSNASSAEPLYQEAIERLGRTRVRAEHGRAHLLYGEWLRRRGRRVDARAQLRAAYKMLAEMGVDAFAERARRELLATGEKVRLRRVNVRRELTEQERQIARLAHDGLSNPQIGERLFLSPRTVEWHLKKVYSKLGITSRVDLRDALPGRDQTETRAARGERRPRLR